MEWLLLSIALWMAVVAVGWRVRRARRVRRSLCRNCQYDYLDVCEDPRRPLAGECDTYLPIEDAIEDGEGSDSDDG